MNILDLQYLIQFRGRPGRSALVDIGESFFTSGSFSVNPTGSFNLPLPLTGFARAWTHLSAVTGGANFGAAGDSIQLSRVTGDSTAGVVLLNIVPSAVLGAGTMLPLISCANATTGSLANATEFKGIEGGFYMTNREFLRVFMTVAAVGATLTVNGWFKDYPI